MTEPMDITHVLNHENPALTSTESSGVILPDYVAMADVENYLLSTETLESQWYQNAGHPQNAT